MIAAATEGSTVGFTGRRLMLPHTATTAAARRGSVRQSAAAQRKKLVAGPGRTNAVIRRRGAQRAMGRWHRRQEERELDASSMQYAFGLALKVIAVSVATV